MQLPSSLVSLLQAPSSDAVWQLRGDLLSRGMDPNTKPFEFLAGMYRFLDRVETGVASRDHSERASKMEVGSISGVVAGDLAEASDPGEWARRLLSATLTEGLAVMATRQHVKAWRGELASVHREAAWYLYDELWIWATRRKPELTPAERRRLLDDVIAPVRADDVLPSAREAILCSLFLVLLVDSLPGDLDADS